MSADLETVSKQLETVGDHFERVMFANGYGVSIVRHSFSYGGTSGLFEVAVLDANGELTYSTPVTDEVLGWLDVAGVLDAMRQVNDLPKALEA